MSSTRGLTLIFLIPLILEFEVWDTITNGTWIYTLGDVYSMCMNLGESKIRGFRIP